MLQTTNTTQHNQYILSVVQAGNAKYNTTNITTAQPLVQAGNAVNKQHNQFHLTLLTNITVSFESLNRESSLL
jgi:hypothetical protein